MSFEVLEQLEGRVQALLDSVGLQRMELDELKEQKQALAQENEHLKQEQHQWQERLRNLLGKMAEVS